ncbi:putative transmembrane anti-sigma factor [Kribbella flavida DSM 17836]|uniref:Putative transmembrane anti-sigma factor n=1 Tax=Kribbella flavida (strain DSM 17836 / JCM 10339 / NBRC 14399) TaxID=479435 RepID=D2PR21_KRIFD|nr:zf-HC2 domain-containing protein [Kribbella flavida]ADB32969.1 putative transmembrane anti-sigma factor [Kribbella flavida DSM 17836]
MNSTEHRALREQLGAFALGHLPPAERTGLQAHLDGCPDCRAELASIAALAEPLRLADPDRVGAEPAAPPAWLEQSILAAVRTEPRRRRTVGRRMLAAAAVLVIGAGGVALGYESAPRPPHIPLEPVAVAASAPGLRSSADVVPHTWGMEIKLTATGFTTGRTYRVVVVTTDGRTAPAGEFIGIGEREMHCNLNSSVLRPDARQFRVLDPSGRSVVTGTL